MIIGMKSILACIMFLAISQITFSQNDSTVVYVNSGTESVALSDYFSMIGAKSLSVTLKDSNLYGHIVYFKIKEFKKSKLKHTKTIRFIDPYFYSKQIYNTKSDSLLIRFMLIKESSKSIKVLIKYPGIWSTWNFKIDPKGIYDFRGILCGNSKYIVNYNEPSPILIYTSPFKLGNMKGGSFCLLGFDGTPVEEWGSKYNLKHYIVFEIVIEEL